MKGFVATLGFSRSSYVVFSEQERQEDWPKASGGSNGLLETDGANKRRRLVGLSSAGLHFDHGYWLQPYKGTHKNIT
jgi:hypothetical protein